MHSTTLFLSLGFNLALTTSAAPLSQLTPTMGPLFTVVSSVPASTATGVANASPGELPKHRHTPVCEHDHSRKYNLTTNNAHNSTAGTKGLASEAEERAAKAMGDSSSYPGSNASAYAYPHSAQSHNHTGDYCNHSSHGNTTATGATYDNIIHPRILTASGPSSPNHTGCRCAHPSHHNGTSANGEHKCGDKNPTVSSPDETHNHTDFHCTHRSHDNGTTGAGRSYDKKSVIPRVDVTVCLGADCKDSKVVTANVDSAGEVSSVDAKNGKRVVKRQDAEMSYEDVAKQMSGARIAGGV